VAHVEASERPSAPRKVDFEQFTATVASFVGRRSGSDPATIDPDFDYIERGLLDSLGTMDLFLFVEETYDMKFPVEDYDVRKANTARTLYAHYASAVSDAAGLAEAS
jgi:acyl carrier protein